MRSTKSIIAVLSLVLVLVLILLKHHYQQEEKPAAQSASLNQSQNTPLQELKDSLLKDLTNPCDCFIPLVWIDFSLKNRPQAIFLKNRTQTHYYNFKNNKPENLYTKPEIANLSDSICLFLNTNYEDLDFQAGIKNNPKFIHRVVSFTIRTSDLEQKTLEIIKENLTEENQELIYLLQNLLAECSSQEADDIDFFTPRKHKYE